MKEGVYPIKKKVIVYARKISINKRRYMVMRRNIKIMIKLLAFYKMFSIIDQYFSFVSLKVFISFTIVTSIVFFFDFRKL